MEKPSYEQLESMYEAEKIRISELELALANAEVMKKRALHETKTPMASIIMNNEKLGENLKAISNAKTDQEKNEALHAAFKSYHQAETAAIFAKDALEIMMLKDLSREQLKKGSRRFRPIKKLKKAVKIHNHFMLTRGLGIILEYSPEFESLGLYGNPAVFSSLFSNLIGNATKYAHKESVIKSMSEVTEETLNFEFENMYLQPIDTEATQRILEKGVHFRRN